MKGNVRGEVGVILPAGQGSAAICMCSLPMWCPKGHLDRSRTKHSILGLRGGGGGLRKERQKHMGALDSAGAAQPKLLWHIASPNLMVVPVLGTAAAGPSVKLPSTAARSEVRRTRLPN